MSEKGKTWHGPVRKLIEERKNCTPQAGKESLVAWLQTTEPILPGKTGTKEAAQQYDKQVEHAGHPKHLQDAEGEKAAGAR